eukprot:TRINITY_DN6459_c0_g1_i1.p1 TRINITY_DN6459_c0_g1~~TRINITY_DN6459_c0_g1_i1.p1  ORF type:complete len:112 (-),score=13.59 TRINITY_DN6459_c0_g1_i1:66-401(-)
MPNAHCGVGDLVLEERARLGRDIPLLLGQAKRLQLQLQQLQLANTFKDAYQPIIRVTVSALTLESATLSLKRERVSGETYHFSSSRPSALRDSSTSYFKNNFNNCTLPILL